jgi:hypothetical protein
VVAGVSAAITTPASAVASLCDATPGNIVMNCGFETGSFAGWTLGGIPAPIGVTNDPMFVHSGTYGAFAGPTGSDATLNQTLATAAPNNTYYLSFWLRSDGGIPNDFSARVSNVVGGTLTFVSKTNSFAFGYTQFGPFQFTTLGAGSPTLTFAFRDDPGFWGLDDVVVVNACTQTVSGTVNSVSTGPGGTCVSNATVNGSVTVNPGTNAIIQNSSIGGSINASNPAGLTLCGSRVGSAVNVSGSTGFVLIGDPGDDACTGNTIGGSVTLSRNTAGLEVSQNPRIGGSLTLSSNSGSGPFLPDDANPEVEANTISGNLPCFGNSAVTNHGQPNHVSGSRTGQCAGL